MDLSPFGINTNGTSEPTSPFAIPGLESLQGTLSTIMLVSAVFGGLFIVLYVIGMIQRIRADRAMIDMRKDVAAIKALMERQAAPQSNAAPAPTAPVTPSETQRSSTAYTN